MANTRGKTALPLPDSLVVGLEGLGYRLVENPFGTGQTQLRTYKVPRHKHLVLQVSPSNLPGDAAVIAAWHGQHATRVDVDGLLEVLEAQIAEYDDPHRSIA